MILDKRLKIIVVLILITSTSFSQSTYVAGVFPTIDHSADINNKWGYGLYYFMAIPLINVSKPDLSKDANTLLFYSEQSLTYKVNDCFSLTGSYVYQRANTFSSAYVNENRFYAQGTYKHSFKSLNLKHRLRFDGRFIQNRMTNETPFTHRLRYLIGMEIPIKSEKNNLYFTMYEEAFFNTFSKASVVYGENWAYAALGIKLNERNKLETGLLYITWNTGANSWFNQ
jgi:hypothetical protein